MKVIIAGSRGITQMQAVEEAVKNSGFEITKVISGGAKGVDSLAIDWARANSVPYNVMPAKWKDIRVDGAVVKENSYGKYNAIAGLMRNEQMATVGDALIAIWDGQSRGTKNMIEMAEKYGLKIYIEKPEPDHV
jgi:hypothetical protein